jgi:hypothetical protein
MTAATIAPVRPLPAWEASTRDRAARIGRTIKAHPWHAAKTTMHAAKHLPTVRKALPWYVLPIVVLAALVKCLPFDGGLDETLFTVAFLLVLWRRPGLLEALYHEAANGKPAPCHCEKHNRKAGQS